MEDAMKVLKVSFEFPLAQKSHLADMRKASVLIDKFKAECKEAGLAPVAVDEVIANRPGRG
jgi:hypothetical protein